MEERSSSWYLRKPPLSRKKGSAFEPQEEFVLDLNGDGQDDIVFSFDRFAIVETPRQS